MSDAGGATTERPVGLVYRPGMLEAAQRATLLDMVEGLDFRAVSMRGISLLSPCRMRFQRRTGDSRQLYALELEPRSGYVLAGSARWAWQHSIPPTKALRYSITFRSLRRP